MEEDKSSYVKVRDVRELLSPDELKIYNMFTQTNGRHTLSNLRAARNKYNMLQALKMTKGYVGKACEIVGIARRTYYAYIAEDPLFAEMVVEIREGIIDQVEDKLLDNIDKGYEASIIFFLKYQGKKRGYGEANQIGAFGGTQEEYYQNRLRDMDDSKLLEEVANLRKKLNVPEGTSIGGFDAVDEEDMCSTIEELKDELRKPFMKDVLLYKDDVKIPKVIMSTKELSLDDMLAKEMGVISIEEIQSDVDQSQNIIIPYEHEDLME